MLQWFAVYIALALMKLHAYLSAALLMSFGAFIGAFSFQSTNANANGVFALIALAGWYVGGAAALLIGTVVLALAIARIGTGAATTTLKRHWLAFVNLGIVVCLWATFLAGSSWR